MNPLITRELLENAGINLADKDVDALIEHLNETVEERIGTEITESLSDEQLEKLLEVQKNGSDEEVGTWLSENVDELEQITQDEVDILLGELADNADDINTAAQ